MNYFWYTEEIIPAGLGFSHYDASHLSWLAVCVAAILISCLVYRRMNEKQRDIFRKSVAAALIANELFKDVPTLCMNLYTWDYLPLHLCNINMFVIAWHAWKPSKTLDNYLYTVCIPGALAAMLFPSWTELPMINYMSIHSFTAHTMLILYPVVLTAAGDIKPELKEVPRSLLILLGLGVVALTVNLLCDTNFMFMMYADEGNPLYWFEQNMGSHLIGLPILTTAVIFVMHTPWCIFRKRNK